MSAEIGITPFRFLFKKEIQRFMKVIGQTVLTPLINSTLYLLIFGVSLGGSVNLGKGIDYISFLIPGLVMMAALNNAYQNSSSSIVGSKFHGDLIDLRVVPISSQQIVWAMALGSLIRGFIVGIATFAVSEVFHYFTVGQLFVIQNPPLFLYFFCIGALCFAMLGIAVGFNATSFEKVNAIGSFVLLPLLYLGGVFFSVKQLHPFWQSISQLNPLLYMINGLRYSCVGISDVSIEVATGVAFLTFVVMFWIATRSVRYGSYTRW
jgi:ABC-2 type transport system permease protein